MNELAPGDGGGGEQRQATSAPWLVVGLGASAGGIKALQDFFTRVPADSGAAFVVVLHLSPEHESHLAEVLQSSSRIPVVRATETLKVEQNHVYVISPNTSLRMADGHLMVSESMRIRGLACACRYLLPDARRHAWTARRSIVLSGTGLDGSSGLKRVKEHGGIIMAQDPRESEYDDMPRNAIATGLVDHILPVAEMPNRLLAMARRFGPVRHEPAVPAVRSAVDALPEILTLIRLRTGHDFSHYKVATVLRRIGRRQVLHDLPDIDAYARFLRDHHDEVQALQRELLISVTQFFRDPEAFAALERNVVPRLFHNKFAQDQVRVWVAGCATGEEAYSLAILLAETASELPEPPAVQVFATDLDEAAIAEARDACYTEADAADISPERLRRFFVAEPGGYRVRRELRETVLFAHHNVLKDPPCIAPRSRVLPQSPHLSQSAGTVPGHADVPLRAPARRLPVPGQRGDAGGRRRSVYALRQERPRLRGADDPLAAAAPDAAGPRVRWPPPAPHASVGPLRSISERLSHSTCTFGCSSSTPRPRSS